MPKHGLRDQYRGFLSIDKLALDECLMEQAEIYSKVAEAVATAEAERDAAQLEFEELQADLDQAVRKKAADKKERLTDATVRQLLPTMPKVQALSRNLLDKKREAKLWRALEKAFEQRADMLKKLVDLHLRSTYGYTLESGVGQARTSIVGHTAEDNRARIRDMRR